jgi:hypothetical protein
MAAFRKHQTVRLDQSDRRNHRQTPQNSLPCHMRLSNRSCHEQTTLGTIMRRDVSLVPEAPMQELEKVGCITVVHSGSIAIPQGDGSRNNFASIPNRAVLDPCEPRSGEISFRRDERGLLPIEHLLWPVCAKLDCLQASISLTAKNPSMRANAQSKLAYFV